METSKNIQKVSLVFFIILGMTHIITGLALKHNYLSNITQILSKITNIPFLMATLTYGFSSLFLQIATPGKPHFLLSTILFASALILLAIGLYFNFFFADIPI